MSASRLTADEISQKAALKQTPSSTAVRLDSGFQYRSALTGDDSPQQRDVNRRQRQHAKSSATMQEIGGPNALKLINDLVKGMP
eukprot:366436-Chlamydomonas_euryale.AAC.2